MSSGILSLLVVVFVFNLIALVNNCGITTHTEIAHRAASHYEYLLDNKTSIAQVLLGNKKIIF